MNRIIAVIAAIYGALYLLPSLLINVLPYLPAALGTGLYKVMPRPPGSLLQAIVQMSFGAVLLIFAWRRWRASPRKSAQYTQHDEGGSVRFEVVPASAPISIVLVLFTLVFAIATIGSRMPGASVFGLLFVAALAVLLLGDNRGGSPSKPRTFRLGQDGIEFGGQRLRRDDIQHLAIRNKFAGEVEVVYDASRGIPTGRVLGLGLRQKLAEVAYRVEVESGGNAHVVAAGLDEVTARGIAAEIGKRLGLGS